jgi:hypothetical protein
MLGYLAFGIFSLVAFFETLTSHMSLEVNALTYRSNFKTQSIQKSDISKVMWEKGCGVSLQTINGEWHKIPSFSGDSQGVVNSIRAWLKS